MDCLNKIYNKLNVSSCGSEVLLSEFLTKEDIESITAYAEKYSDGVETIYEISQPERHYKFFLHDDGCGACFFKYPSIEEFLADWELENYNNSLACILAAFDLDPNLNVVYEAGIKDQKVENQKGTFAIWVEQFYYENNYQKTPDNYVQDDEGVMVFDNLADAIAKAEELEKEQYTVMYDGSTAWDTSYGKYSSDRFLVVEY